MTTVRELKEFIKDIPDDTKVVVQCYYFLGFDTVTAYKDADFDELDGNVEHIDDELYFGGGT